MVYMSIMTATEVFWIVKLPPELKEVFEKIAEAEGDDTHGAGARQLRKFLKKRLKEGSA